MSFDVLLLILLLFIVEGGYCQSMNFIAALLLLHMEKELAFYTQVCINRLLFTNYFTEDLVCFDLMELHLVWGESG